MSGKGSMFAATRVQFHKFVIQLFHFKSQTVKREKREKNKGKTLKRTEYNYTLALLDFPHVDHEAASNNYGRQQ
jgi:hypothetical protein